MTRLKYVRSDYLMEHYPQVYAEIERSVVAKRPIFTMRNCLRAVCQVYGVTADEIKGRSRKQCIVVPRNHFCWVVYRNRIDVSYPMIGRFLKKDHTTIIHGVEKFEEMKVSRENYLFPIIMDVNSLIFSMYRLDK